MQRLAYRKTARRTKCLPKVAKPLARTASRRGFDCTTGSTSHRQVHRYERAILEQPVLDAIAVRAAESQGPSIADVHRYSWVVALGFARVRAIRCRSRRSKRAGTVPGRCSNFRSCSISRELDSSSYQTSAPTECEARRADSTGQLGSVRTATAVNTGPAAKTARAVNIVLAAGRRTSTDPEVPGHIVQTRSCRDPSRGSPRRFAKCCTSSFDSFASFASCNRPICEIRERAILTGDEVALARIDHTTARLLSPYRTAGRHLHNRSNASTSLRSSRLPALGIDSNAHGPFRTHECS
ncbi:hypothetical protein RRSWK_01291 [Rhodopirellula sp. SWK7]|nr:hypothetical protein RRSWK_01291 [Rhodopirellula sp. SWK7]